MIIFLQVYHVPMNLSVRGRNWVCLKNSDFLLEIKLSVTELEKRSGIHHTTISDIVVF